MIVTGILVRSELETMYAPELELFCRLEVDLASIRELGSGRAGSVGSYRSLAAASVPM